MNPNWPFPTLTNKSFIPDASTRISQLELKESRLSAELLEAKMKLQTAEKRIRDVEVKYNTCISHVINSIKHIQDTLLLSCESIECSEYEDQAIRVIRQNVKQLKATQTELEQL